MDKKSKILMFLVAIGSTIYNATLPLHPDEAYYWVWSKNLQLSYYDHPPMVAYLIKLITLIGSSEYVIRLVAVLSILATSWFIYQLAREMFNEKVARISLILFVLMPLVQSGLIVVTPDSPLSLFWAATIYFLRRYLKTFKNRYIYITGLLAGFLLLSKYTGILLLFALFSYLIFSKNRILLKRKEIYIAVLIAFVVFLPVIIWNYNHDFISFKFQLSHGAQIEKSPAIDNIILYLAGQIMVFNPIFFILLIGFIVKNFKDHFRHEDLSFLTWPFLFPLLFFACFSINNPAEANWPGPAYITGVIILAYWLNKVKIKKTFYLGIIVGMIFLVLIRFPEFIPGLPAKAILKSDFYGYPQIFNEANNFIEPDGPLLSDSYQNASEAWYYFEGNPKVYIITKTRFSNYTIWNREIFTQIRDGKINKAYYIGKKRQVEELQNYFKEVRLLSNLEYKNKFMRRNLYLYLCLNE